MKILFESRQSCSPGANSQRSSDSSNCILDLELSLPVSIFHRRRARMLCNAFSAYLVLMKWKTFTKSPNFKLGVKPRVSDFFIDLHTLSSQSLMEVINKMWKLYFYFGRNIIKGNFACYSTYIFYLYLSKCLKFSRS